MTTKAGALTNATKSSSATPPARFGAASHLFAPSVPRTDSVEGDLEAVAPDMGPPPLFHFGKIPIQAKLTVGPAGDAFEMEADETAERVMRMPDPAAKAGGEDEDEKELRREKWEELHPGAAGVVQRKCGKCAEEEGAGEQLQRKAVGGAVAETAAPAIVHEVLGSPGVPLDAGTRAFMEPRFGADFGGVRVHADARAAESAAAVGARAYTVKQHVVLGAASLSQGSAEGRRLLAHELTHVVQQKAGAGTALQRWPDKSKQTDGCYIGKMHGPEVSEVKRKLKEYRTKLGDRTRVPAWIESIGDSEELQDPGKNHLTRAVVEFQREFSKIRPLKHLRGEVCADTLEALNEALAAAQASSQTEILFAPDPRGELARAEIAAALQHARRNASLVVPEEHPKTTGAKQSDRDIPPAADALKGIRLAFEDPHLGQIPSGGLPDREGAIEDKALIFKRGPYSIVPTLRRTVPSEEGTKTILFYSALRDETKQFEWYIGPDSLEKFLGDIEKYARVGANRANAAEWLKTASPHERKDYELVHAIFQQNWSVARDSLIDLRLGEVKNPWFWVGYLFSWAGAGAGGAGVGGALEGDALDVAGGALEGEVTGLVGGSRASGVTVNGKTNALPGVGSEGPPPSGALTPWTGRSTPWIGGASGPPAGVPGLGLGAHAGIEVPNLGGKVAFDVPELHTDLFGPGAWPRLPGEGNVGLGGLANDLRLKLDLPTPRLLIEPSLPVHPPQASWTLGTQLGIATTGAVTATAGAQKNEDKKKSCPFATGSKTDPIPMTWYKPTTLYDNIITLYTGKGHRNQEKFSMCCNTKELAGSGEMLGVDPKNFPFEGKPMQRVKPREREESKRFRKILADYEFDWDLFQADHVHELAFGGTDTFDNLWPLSNTANMSVGSRNAGQTVTYCNSPNDKPRSGQINRDNALLGRWFIVDTIKDPRGP